MRRSWAVPLLAVSLGLLALPATASAVPGNDDYANADTISGINTEVSGDNTAATMQTSEPNYFGFGSRSVWYTWTAPSSETVQIHTCNGPDLDTIIEVFTDNGGGTPPGSGLDLVGRNDQACGDNSDVEFDAVMGTVYKIQVMGYLGDQGSFVLRVSDQIPVVTIDSGPGFTTSSNPTWAFHSSIGGSQFDCQIYTDPSFDLVLEQMCSSPFTSPVSLPPGNYEFDLFAISPTKELGFNFRTFGVQAAPGQATTPPAGPGVTGLRAAALKKCKKKRSARARRNCRRRANALPLAHSPGLLSAAR